jgi:structural maintenance of chromosome 2
MRPPEILSLVEEAAGTRMFEERKDKALKSIQKKEKRVQEIESLLHEEIIPKLDALRAEKKQWMEYIKTCSQLEKIGRVLRAYEYTEAGKKAAKKAEERAEKEARVGEVEKGKKDLRRAIEKSGDEVKRITEARAKEMKAGGKYQKLEERVSTIGKEMERVKTRVELKEKSVEEEGKRQKKAEEGLQAVCFRPLPFDDF